MLESTELVLDAICSRLRYGVYILHEGWNFEWDEELSTIEKIVGIDEKFIYTKIIDTHNGEEYREDKHPIDTFDDKLILRSLSSMTNEEKEELYKATGFYYRSNTELLTSEWKQFSDSISDNNLFLPYPIWKEDLLKIFSWFKRNHFDYEGLIPMNLAVDVTNTYNPYKL